MILRKAALRTYACICILVILNTGCGKHMPDSLPDDPIPVAGITISSPLPGAAYTNGDSVQITANAKSTAEFHQYELYIKKLNDTAVYYSEITHQHADSISINTKWKDSLTTAADLELVLIFLLDHDGHTLTRKVSFRSQ